MSLVPITLRLPDELYERIREAAEDTQRSPETVLLQSLQVLFSHPESEADVEATMAAMQDYTVPQLWSVVYRRLPLNQTTRLRALTEKSKLRVLDTAEATELEQLLNRVDQAMLLRSEALRLLKSRGEDIDDYFYSRP